MKAYIRSSSAGQLKAGLRDEVFDDSLEESTRRLSFNATKEANMNQKTLRAVKISLKNHARSQGSLMSTLVRRSDRTLQSQIKAQQLEINKMKTMNVKEARDSRKYRKPTLFDVSMEHEKDLELIQEISRTVSRDDLKVLTQTAKESEDIVEPFIRYVQSNNNIDEFLQSMNKDKSDIRPHSAKAVVSFPPPTRQRPYSAIALGQSNTTTPAKNSVKVRPALSAPKQRPNSATNITNNHLVKYDLSGLHSPRSPRTTLRRPSMSDSIDSNMMHVEQGDYIDAFPEKRKESVPLNIRVEIPNLHRYVRETVSPDSRTTLSVSPLKTPQYSRLYTNNGKREPQRPPLHSALSYQHYNYSTRADTPVTHGISSAQTSAINIESQVIDESELIVSEANRELSGMLASDSHREIFGYTPVASVKQTDETLATPKGIAVTVTAIEDDPFMIAIPPDSPTLSRSKGRRILPFVETQKHKNLQTMVDDVIVCSIMRSEISPEKIPERRPRSPSSPNSPKSPNSGLGFDPRYQPRWK